MLLSSDQFLEHLRTSRLLNEQQVAAAARIATQDQPPSADELATKLMQSGLLTRWQAEMLLAGQTAFYFGRYKLLNPLGQGGMGAVFQAEHVRMGRVVALKVMSQELLKDDVAVARFHREIQAAAALDHPNIVHALDADRVGDVHFLVMEYLPGEDLGTLCKRRGPLPIGEACEYIRQAAEGLQHAYERGMVHRDIKPANLLVTDPAGQGPVVKILDFGLAKLESETAVAGNITTTGQIMGTPDYISPEQATDTHSADIRSDIYSLGCTLYRLIAGEVPFTGKSMMEKLMARAQREPLSLSVVRPETPAGLSAVVQRMLARDPLARYQTPAEVAIALAEFAEPPPEWGAELTLPDADLAPTVQLTQGSAEALAATVSAAMPENREYARFLQLLATEAESESDLEAAPAVDGAAVAFVPDAAPVRRSRIQQTIEARKAADRRKLLTVGLVLLLVAALAGGVAAWVRSGQTALLIEWNEAERAEGSLTVDGRTVLLPRRGPLEYRSGAGPRSVRLTRPGYFPIEFSGTLSRGEATTIRADWKPKPETVRRLEWQRLDQELETLLTGHGASASPHAPELMALEEKLHAFRGTWTGRSEETRAAAAALRRLPSTLDRLSGSSARPANAVQYDSSAPLVGVIGPQDLRLTHEAAVTSIAFSPDGAWFIAGSTDGTVKVWDAQTGALLRTLPDPIGASTVLVTPDGRSIIVVGYSGVGVHNAETGELVYQPMLAEHPSTLARPDVSLDGRWLAVPSYRGGVWIIDLQEQTVGKADDLMAGEVAPETVTEVGWNPEGDLLATSNQLEVVRVWERSSGRVLHTWNGKFADFLDEHRIALWRSGSLYIWDLKEGEDEALRTPIRIAERVRYSGDRSRIASTNGLILDVYDAATYSKIWSWDYRESVRQTCDTARFSALSFSPDGTRLAVGFGDGAIRVFDTESGRLLLGPSELAGVLLSVAVSPDGRTLASSQDGMIRLWNLADGTVRREIPVRNRGRDDLEFHPNGRWLASHNYLSDEAILWDLETGRELRRFRHVAHPCQLAFTPGGEKLAIAGAATVSLWDPASGKSLGTIEVDGLVYGIAFSPLEDKIATSGHTGTQCWQLLEHGGTRLWKVALASSSYMAQFSPDGKTVAMANILSTGVHFLDFRSGKMIHMPHALMGGSALIAYAPSGKLFVRLLDGELILHEMRFKREVRRFRIGPPEMTVHEIVFAPDGRHLLVATGSGATSILRLDEWQANLLGESGD